MKVCILVTYLLALFCGKVQASSITLSASQSEILHDQEVIVQSALSIQAGDGTNYYLRGVFYKEGTSDYCGITWNGSEWFSGPYTSNEGWKKFLKITISNNSWQGEIKAKVDRDDSGCRDSGQYKFKIQRFNEGSGSSHFDDQSELSLNILIPTSTPSPTPTLKPQPTSKPTSAPKPEPTRKNTPTSTQSLNKNETKQDLSHVVEEEIVEEEVLGETSKSISDFDPNRMLGVATSSGMVINKRLEDEKNVEKNSEFQKKSPLVTIGGVFSLLASCGILLMRKIRT